MINTETLQAARPVPTSRVYSQRRGRPSLVALVWARGLNLCISFGNNTGATFILTELAAVRRAQNHLLWALPAIRRLLARKVSSGMIHYLQYIRLPVLLPIQRSHTLDRNTIAAVSVVKEWARGFL
jgi:hypothetical protein